MSPTAVFCEHFAGPAALVLRATPIREPAAAELLIEVHAAGVNFPDLMVSHGTYQDLYPLPFVIGKEGAGIVRKVGPGASAFAPGDRVAFHMDAGAFSEQVIVPAAQAYPVPQNVALTDAATMVLAYQTAYFTLTERVRLEPNEWLLVVGASGGVGIATVQLGRALGARVVAGINDPAKEGFVRSHGAEAVVYLNTLQLPRLLEGVRDATQGHGADAMVDTIGGDSFNAAIRTVVRGGRVAIVGFTSGTIPSIKTNYLLLKNLALVGVNWGFYRDGAPTCVAHAQEAIFDFASRGVFGSPVTQRLPLRDVALALTRLERREVMGKLVLSTRYAR